MGNNTCVTNVNIFNATNPCYLDTTNNRIWIRLPHFSGNKPLVTGSVVTAATVTPEASSDEGGGGGIPSTIKRTHSWTEITPGVAAIMKDFPSDIGIKQIEITVNNKAQNVKVTVTKYDGKPAEVSVEKSGSVYQYVQINTTNLLDKLSKAKIQFRVERTWTESNSVEKENVVVSKFDEENNVWNELNTTYSSEDDTYYYYDIEVSSFSYFAISEKSLVSADEGAETTGGEEVTTISTMTWVWVSIGVAVLVVVAVVLMMKRKK